MDAGDSVNEGIDRPGGPAVLNAALAREGFEVLMLRTSFAICATSQRTRLTMLAANPFRPLSAAEMKKRDAIVAYLDKASEDELIGEVLLPRFRQIGFQRVTTAGHKD